MDIGRLSERIGRSLRERGIRRRQAAAVLNLPTEGLFRRLNGTVPWRVHELETLATLCGVPLSSWLDEAVTKPPEHISTVISRVIGETIQSHEKNRRGA